MVSPVWPNPEASVNIFDPGSSVLTRSASYRYPGSFPITVVEVLTTDPALHRLTDMGSVNVLLTTFPGCELPPTVCLPVPHDLSSQSLLRLVASLTPGLAFSNVYVTATNNRRVVASQDQTVASFLSTSCAGQAQSNFLPLRLHVPLVGGKGGFGSQLRAAGGRMSTRKKRQNAELATGSARNLDGRRLRTITEAKNLATYLATRPDMDRKEKEERRKRWETVVELAEQREADMRAGKTVDGRRKGLSSEWLEEKEEVGENVKNAVKMAMTAAEREPNKGESSGSGGSAADSTSEDSDDEDIMELDEPGMSRLRKEAEAGDADAIWVLRNRLKIPEQMLPQVKKPVQRFAGFDEDDDDISGSEEGDAEDEGERNHGDNSESVSQDIKGKSNP